MGKTPLHIGIEQARLRIRKFCDYRERNHREVREKLYSFGLYTSQIEPIIAELVGDNLLNEERYARAFAGGKFRIKQWGKVKIVYELKKQQISPYCIKKGLQEIADDDYMATLKKLAIQKRDQLRSVKNKLMKKQKIYLYLQQKGYEPQFIYTILSEILAP